MAHLSEDEAVAANLAAYIAEAQRLFAVDALSVVVSIITRSIVTSTI